jgi:hypothetical protein
MNRSRIRHGNGTTTSVETVQSINVPAARNSQLVNEKFKGTPRTLREGSTPRLMSNGAAAVDFDTVGSLSLAFRNRPWAAPSVQELSSQMGQSRHADPIIIETPMGDVLSAVGSSADHVIATRMIQSTRESQAQSRHPSVPLSRHGQQLSFGAVYEHRDCFGVPKFIAKTGQVPEAAMAGDVSRHQAVKNMLSHESGSSKVVWAGTGRGVVGNREMEAITKGILDKRAAELHAEKLRGPKPYSRHGY